MPQPDDAQRVNDARKKRAEKQSIMANQKHLGAVLCIVRAGTGAEECTEIASVLRQVAESCKKGAEWWEAKGQEGGIA